MYLPLPVQDDPVWLEAGLLVEVDEGGLHHAAQAQDHVLPGLQQGQSIKDTTWTRSALAWLLAMQVVFYKLTC